MFKCIDCSKEIESGKLCKFCKCFKRPIKSEVSMTKEQMSARLRFQEILVKEGYSYMECAEMSLVELRDCVDEINPLVIVDSGLTVQGGRTKKVTVVRKAA